MVFNSRLFIQILYLISFIFLMLPAFVIDIGQGYRSPFFYFSMAIIVSAFILNFKKSVKYILYLCQKTAFKYLCYFILYVLVSLIILVILHKYPLGLAIKNFFGFVIFRLLPIYLFSAFFIPRYVSFRTFIKMYLFAVLFIMIFGLFGYIGYTCSNSILTKIFEFIANERILSHEYYYSGRLSSVFAEPGFMGGWIFINLPVLYKLAQSRFKIFKNPNLNKAIKISIVPLTWICLILAMSPIWISFGVIQFLILYVKNIIHFVKKYVSFIIPYIVVVLLFLVSLTQLESQFNFEKPVLSRISATIGSIGNFDRLIYAEESLATRIVSYYQKMQVFKKHPILGVGVENDYNYVLDEFIHSKIPITREHYFHLLKTFNVGTKFTYNYAIFYDIACNFGILGLIFFYLFLFKTYKYLSSKIKCYSEGLIKDFSLGLKTSILFFFFITFYDTLFIAYHYNCFFLGLCVAFSLYKIPAIERSDNEE